MDYKIYNEMLNEANVADQIFDQLAGQYWYAWKTGRLENSRYIELAKKYDVETAVDEFMDDVDAMLDD